MPCCGKSPIKLSVGARDSPLSLVQVREIWNLIQKFYPQMEFDVHTISTIGDRDQKTSLRVLERTDFFTKEIDEWVLEEKCRVGIHSAKDLPSPLTMGLSIFCITQGLDPADALVMRQGESILSLPKCAKIATSSIRREEAVRLLRNDFQFCDLRGTISERLLKLENGEADGVVVAEAALIRLGLTHLNRIRLEGPTAEGQGRLAVVGREDDDETKKIFASLDFQKKV